LPTLGSVAERFDEPEDACMGARDHAQLAVFAESDEIERLEALWNDLPTFSNERGSNEHD
jgi:hypothetical protein